MYEPQESLKCVLDNLLVAFCAVSVNDHVNTRMERKLQRLVWRVVSADRTHIHIVGEYHSVEPKVSAQQLGHDSRGKCCRPIRIDVPNKDMRRKHCIRKSICDQLPVGRQLLRRPRLRDIYHSQMRV